MTMKDKKNEFESFEESKKSSEIFSFSEKNNEKQFLNEDFVFKFEENKEYEKAFYVYSYYAQKGNTNAIFKMGWYYDNGFYVKQDYQK